MPWQIGRYTPGVREDAETFDFELLQEGFRRLQAQEGEADGAPLPCEEVQDEGPSRYAHVQAALVHGAKAFTRFCLVYLCPWPGDDEDTYVRVLRRR